VSTIPRTTDSCQPPPPDDPYFYGFRERQERGPDGKKRLVSIPLTEEDVLHPLEGDHLTQNTPHQTDCLYLSDAIDLRLVGVAGTVRLSDCSVDLGLAGVRPVGPDVAVCLGVTSEGPWSSFSVAEEGAMIALIVEITSPSTRRTDLEDKPSLYWRAGVQCYVIVDQVSMRGGVRQLRLLAFERGARRWRRMRLRRGRVWLDVVQLWLGVENGRVVCWDAEGREILAYSELGEAHAAAEQALQEAAERIRQLEEENRRLRGES
jgi:Uma2 family endonuclease